MTLSTKGEVEATLEGGGERQKGFVGCSIWIHCVVTGGGDGWGGDSREESMVPRNKSANLSSHHSGG